MKIQYQDNLCTGCSACFNICNQNAISMNENDEGFKFPEIDSSLCIKCGFCDVVCPETNAQKIKGESLVQKTFYGWHNDEIVRINSSSGGLFSAIAEYVISEGGVVFGAVFDPETRQVIHKSTQYSELDALRKSKYVQSFSGDTFRQVKKLLNAKEKILYVGTPCQIAGLNSFLGKENKNLLTCDFICHGVPPMKFFNEYISLLEKKNRSKIANIDFRSKVKGWSKYYFKCYFVNKEPYYGPASLDIYYNAFFRNLSLRKSCFHCRYSEDQHCADMTLADYWGYRRYNPDIGDEKGLSLLIINTKKGYETLKRLRNLTLKPLDWEYGEYVFHKRTPDSYSLDKRNKFFEYYSHYGFKQTIRKYKLSGTLITRIKFFLRQHHIPVRF